MYPYASFHVPFSKHFSGETYPTYLYRPGQEHKEKALFKVYPQLPTYERAVGNYGYSDFRGVGRQVNFEATPCWFESQRQNHVNRSCFSIRGIWRPRPYGLRSGYNGYGLGYNGYGYRGVLGYSGLLGGYGGVIGLRK
ncbi:hypothetical protein CEXT_487801 [Caerostris extrusa]|uniref:Uncharacterized protein n=1 Tax=Caerostris extrusa TaxID=172846 RepID=A0AAV4UIN0_CAEEX|nr:hypothetical protein CEXT_487801 [Caerostris extrusa]